MIYCRTIRLYYIVLKEHYKSIKGVDLDESSKRRLSA